MVQDDGTDLDERSYRVPYYQYLDYSQSVWQ